MVVLAKKWTKDQESAIYAKWCDENKTKSANILVNAAAGSGKTAVLVERIINKLCAEPSSPDYCTADSLLVVTFTNAAAKEMQQRIFDALTKKYNEALAINDVVMADMLKKQIDNIYSADITTIDSFCLKIIRNYFHLLKIDPNFTIIDKAQGDMLKEETLEELFEIYFSNENFIKLLSIYADNRDEAGLGDILLKIYNFTRSVPNPKRWLDDKKKMFEECSADNLWFSTISEKIKNEAIKCRVILREALCYMIDFVGNTGLEFSETELMAWLINNPPNEENDLYMYFWTYYECVYNEYFFYKSLEDMNTEEMKKPVRLFEFMRINTKPAIQNADMQIKDSDILATVKNARDNAKSAFIKNIRGLVSYFSDDMIENLRNEQYEAVSLLCDFSLKFEEMYRENKRKKNVMEFSDIEHMCLELFENNPDVCENLREKYVEILMDEYQDSNELQEGIFKKISRGNNLFMVGDMKQSIYRFRNSDPTLFKNKCDTYDKSPSSKNRKIVLGKNFRSRKEVLYGINSVFEGVMCEEVGEINYDDDQRLNFGDESYEKKNDSYKCECCIVLDSKSDEDATQKISDAECEAKFVAKKIKELKDSKFLVRDRRNIKDYDENGDIIDREEIYYRPVQNRDFAIILSAYRNISKIFSDELAKLGIESFTQNGGYFDRPEVRMVINLLKMINNPFNDVALLSVMRSPIFYFSDDELCQIRKHKTDTFYEAVMWEAKEQADISQKCTRLIDKINTWREYTKFMASDKLLWTLYEETGIYSFCEAVFSEEAGVNLRLLFSRAKAYEASGYKGIFNFIRYIDKLKKREEDLSGAVVFDDDTDAVRIMSIHKSKGLEFPVVFVSRCGTGFNTSDSKGHLLLDKELGFGPDYINYESSLYVNTAAKKAIEIKIQKESVAEEMRKLYVALTRAKEKLYVTAVCGGEVSEAKDVGKWRKSVVEGRMPAYIGGEVNKFIDWVAPMAMMDQDNWNFSVTQYKDCFFDEVDVTNSQYNAELIEITDDKYKYENSLNVGVKVSVSEINAQHTGNSRLLPPKAPQFLSDEEAGGAMRGTAVHYVMQKFIPDSNVTPDKIQGFIDRLYHDEELSEAEYNAVNACEIYDFYNSEIGKRILKSPKVLREVPFEIEIPASEIYDGASDEPIMLQGIIDCCFYEDGQVVIVDYKTDKNSDIIKIKQKYSLQLEYYSRAIEKILKIHVKNKYIYLFLSKNVIKC